MVLHEGLLLCHSLSRVDESLPFSNFGLGNLVVWRCTQYCLNVYQFEAVGFRLRFLRQGNPTHNFIFGTYLGGNSPQKITLTSSVIIGKHSVAEWWFNQSTLICSWRVQRDSKSSRSVKRGFRGLLRVHPVSSLGGPKESRDVLWGLIWSSGVLLGTNLLRILGGLKEVLRSPTS